MGRSLDRYLCALTAEEEGPDSKQRQVYTHVQVTWMMTHSRTVTKLTLLMKSSVTLGKTDD
jgi:hypothetical protein